MKFTFSINLEVFERAGTTGGRKERILEARSFQWLRFKMQAASSLIEFALIRNSSSTVENAVRLWKDYLPVQRSFNRTVCRMEIIFEARLQPVEKRSQQRGQIVAKDDTKPTNLIFLARS